MIQTHSSATALTTEPQKFTDPLCLPAGASPYLPGSATLQIVCV